mgnify:CR=1 FL=1
MKKEAMNAEQWARWVELDDKDMGPLECAPTPEETKELGEMNRKYMNPDGTMNRESDTYT